jgi:hypothetical protein
VPRHHFDETRRVGRRGEAFRRSFLQPATDADNFIFRDSRCFRIEVDDEHAVDRQATHVTVRWGTLRTDYYAQTVENDCFPANFNLTLVAKGQGNRFLSDPLMLVTDADDYAQETRAD